MSAPISPVYAPFSSWCTFWAPTPTPAPAGVAASASRTAARHTNGGQITRWTPSTSVRMARVVASSAASAGVVCIFQLAAMITGRITGSCQSCPLRVGGQQLDPLERPLDGRTMDEEVLAQLSQRRLGRRPASSRGQAHDPGQL